MASASLVVGRVTATSATSWPAMALSREDLPDPVGPASATTVCSGRRRRSPARDSTCSASERRSSPRTSRPSSRACRRASRRSVRVSTATIAPSSFPPPSSEPPEVDAGGNEDGAIVAVLTLTERLDALRQALDEGRDVLGDDLRSDAEHVLSRAGDRLRLPEHTVVALAGPTGSGKSSLLNAMAGHDVAEVAGTRPTTSEALAIVRGDGAGPLLDWLGVRRRHHLGGEGDGLVVLDLPDHDSVATDHRLEAERLVALVDLMVWVVDPQKYADAAVHEQYLRGLAGHRDVLLVVLNQVDRLSADERRACHRDLQRLLAQDDLEGVPVLDVSARTGEGVDRLAAALADAARRRVAAKARLGADVAGVAGRVLATCGPPVRGGRASRDELVDALADAAGVPVVVEAVHAARLRSARQATGWPPTRWLSRFRPDPLRRLHLGRADSGHTSLPKPGPAQLARARGAVRAYLDGTTAGAPEGWVLAARRRAR